MHTGNHCQRLGKVKHQHLLDAKQLYPMVSSAQMPLTGPPTGLLWILEFFFHYELHACNNVFIGNDTFCLRNS